MFDTGLTVGILIGVPLGILGTVLFYDITRDKPDGED